MAPSKAAAPAFIKSAAGAVADAAHSTRSPCICACAASPLRREATAARCASRALGPKPLPPARCALVAAAAMRRRRSSASPDWSRARNRLDASAVAMVCSWRQKALKRPPPPDGRFMTAGGALSRGACAFFIAAASYLRYGFTANPSHKEVHRRRCRSQTIWAL
eukprot:5259918-Pyramimonas_sp.AAC.1